LQFPSEGKLFVKQSFSRQSKVGVQMDRKGHIREKNLWGTWSLCILKFQGTSSCCDEVCQQLAYDETSQ